jgi:hypothetical protein
MSDAAKPPPAFKFSVEALASICARAYEVGWTDRDAMQRLVEAEPGEPPPREVQIPSDINLVSERINQLVLEITEKLQAKAEREKSALVLPPGFTTDSRNPN